MPLPVVSTLLILQANNHIHGSTGVRAHVHAHSPASVVLLPVWPLMLDTHFNEKDNPYHCFHQAAWSFFIFLFWTEIRAV